AQAYLRPDGGRFAGTWLDSEGSVTSFEGRLEGHALVLEWAHEVVGPERIVFTLVDEGRLEMTTFARKGAAWEPTGRIAFTRGCPRGRAGEGEWATGSSDLRRRMLAMGVDPGPSRTGYNRVDGVLEPRGGGATHAWVSE